jgi:hypothetical protein
MVINMVNKINVDKYNPCRLDNDDLCTDWNVATSLYHNLIEGEDKPYTITDIMSFAKKIHLEMVKRISEGILEHKFKPEKMNEPSRKIYTMLKDEMFGSYIGEVKLLNQLSLSDVRVFDDITKVEDELKIEFSDIGTQYSIDKSYGGLRSMLHKSGDVKIYVDGQEVTESFPKIASQLKILFDGDLIIDGEIVRHEEEYLNSDNPDAFFSVNDLIYMDEDVRKEKWINRKKRLLKLKYTPNIKSSYSLIVGSPDELREGYEIIKNAPLTLGVAIRNRDSKYKEGYILITV